MTVTEVVGLYHFLGCSKEIGFVNQRIPLGI